MIFTKDKPELFKVCDVIEREQGKQVWMKADNSVRAGLSIGDYLSLGSSRTASRESLYSSALFGTNSHNSINNLSSDLNSYSASPRARSRAVSLTPSPNMMNRHRSSTNPEMSYKLRSALSPPTSR